LGQEQRHEDETQEKKEEKNEEKVKKVRVGKMAYG